jgi:hypothetical protein
MSAEEITSFQQWSSNASLDAMAASNRDPMPAESHRRSHLSDVTGG